MSLRRVSDRYSSDRESAKGSVKYWAGFIRDNIKWLREADPKGVHEKFFEEVREAALNGDELLDWQVSRLERIYELVWKGYEMPSVKVHVDRKRKGLRY